MNKPTVQIYCPTCQHQQTEPEGVVSTNCRACGHYIRVSETVLKPVVRSPRATRIIQCYSCETEIRVVESAISSICPQCSAHLDLQNHKLTAGDDSNINTLGTVTICGTRKYEGNEIYASTIEIACKVSARLIARKEAVFSNGGTLQGKLEAPKISVSPKAVARARLLITPLLHVAGEIVCVQVRAKKIIIESRGNLFAKNIFCEELEIIPGGVLRGRLTTFNMETKPHANRPL